MDIDFSKEEKIDRYLSGLMEDEEIGQFEQQIAQDDSLKKEIDLQRQIILAIQSKNVRQIFSSEEKRIVEHKKSGKTIRMFVYALSAAACLVFGFFYFQNVATYREYGLQCYNNMAIDNSRGENDVDKILQDCYEEIGKQEYDAAEKKLKNVIDKLEKATFDETEVGQYDKEIAKMQKDEANWYLAISYMRSGQLFKAKSLLKKISISGSKYKNDALEVLKK